MASEVAESISKHSGAPMAAVTVIFHDVPPDNWASGGVLFSDKQVAASGS